MNVGHYGGDITFSTRITVEITVDIEIATRYDQEIFVKRFFSLKLLITLSLVFHGAFYVMTTLLLNRRFQWLALRMRPSTWKPLHFRELLELMGAP